MLKNLFYRTVSALTTLPRNRMTYRLVDNAHHFLYKRSMSLSLPWLCSYCAYRIRKDERHDYCNQELRKLKGEYDEPVDEEPSIEDESSEDEKNWNEYQAERAAEEAAFYQAVEDRFRLEQLMASFCTEPGCYEDAINPDDKCDTHTINVDDDYDDRDDEDCPGGCGQPANLCTCAELESLRRHNADPATRGSWWVA